MAAKGYTTSALVAALLGVTFTSAQQTHCNTLIEEAEAAIDAYCNRAWKVGATQETRFYPAASLYLAYPPVASVESITGRARMGADEVELAAGVDYELVDARSGLVRLVYPGAYERLLVSYTQEDVVPADIRRATAELVAAWMQTHLRPDTFGVESFQYPDLMVRFSRSYLGQIPPSVEALLALHRFEGLA